MPQKNLTIVPYKKAKSLLPKILRDDSLCYFLTDDYVAFRDLQERFTSGTREIRSLAGLFDATFQELKIPFLEVIASLNKKINSVEWWSGQLASRNSAGIPLLLNFTYLFCAKKILAQSYNPIIFVVKSHALAGSIAAMAKDFGYVVKDYRGWGDKYVEVITCGLLYAARIFLFLLRSYRSRRAAFRIFEPLPQKKAPGKRRIVLRSWVTPETFDNNGKFRNRNFGSLPTWLTTRGYEIWNLPLLYNFSMKIETIYALMRNQDQPFLIPDRYLAVVDYFYALRAAWTLLKTPIKSVHLQGIEVGPFFREALKHEGFGTLSMHLSFFLLKRLKEDGYEIDGFYYPFEGNSIEKPFLLACRKYFPEAKTIGFQHTTFFPNQLAYHLAPGESCYHPLPERIVCSGPIYLRLLREAGFPPEILVLGSNLRFKDVHGDRGEVTNHAIESKGTEKRLLIPLPGMPLPFTHAFELLWKVITALKGLTGYQLYLRNHPVLPKDRVSKFLHQMGVNGYRYADEGIIQDWLRETHAVLTIGTSITALESASMGVPVIRIVPDNALHFDPLICPEYPLQPAHSPSEIKQRLRDLDRLLCDDRELFSKIGRRFLSEHFVQPTDENMKVFLQ